MTICKSKKKLRAPSARSFCGPYSAIKLYSAVRAIALDPIKSPSTPALNFYVISNFRAKLIIRWILRIWDHIYGFWFWNSFIPTHWTETRWSNILFKIHLCIINRYIYHWLKIHSHTCYITNIFSITSILMWRGEKWKSSQKCFARNV